MNCFYRNILTTLFAGCVLLSYVSSAQAEYFRIGDDGAVCFDTNGQTLSFRPDFMLIYSDEDPKLGYRRADIENVSYTVPTWVRRGLDAEGVRNDDTEVSAGDGLDPKILGGDNSSRTADYFRAASHELLTADRVEAGDDSVTWRFSTHPKIELEVRVALGQADALPLLTVNYRVKQPGWYSLGYVGAPQYEPGQIDELWQPFIWHERRFPSYAYATPSHQCPIPTTLVSAAGMTIGVIVSPEEIPFQPLPTSKNARFACLVRNHQAKVQSTAFYPMYGGVGSELKAGNRVSFEMLLLAREANLVDTYEYVARQICQFENSRQNLDISLNQTIANIIDYGMSEYSHFNADLRGCAYDTDVPNAVKNVSALHPLSLALIYDRRDIFDQRALPILEYMLSREKLLFSLDPKMKIQSPSSRIAGPCANVSELAVLHAMSGGRDFAMLQYAQDLYGKTRVLNLDSEKRGDTWQSALTLFEATGDERYRQQMQQRVDAYLKKRVQTMQTDFTDPYASHMFFWPAFVPQWFDLYMVYELTGDQRFLDAAHDGARRYATFTWMLPIEPDGDVLVNPGGKAPLYGYLKSKGHAPMRAPEARVPAWQVSEHGLTPESSGTAHGHRAIFPATYAPWMLRIAKHTGDTFLRDVARSAVVGRYRNFPGYHINTARSNVYMQADYPLRSHQALSYNSMHYNHVWPMASLLFDYLISDMYFVSDGAIDFPGRYIEGYAYFQTKAYGDRPGAFYDRDEAWLWMPSDLLKVDNSQLNYITARTDNELLIALANQSDTAVNATLRLNPDRFEHAISEPHVVSVWRQNKASSSMQMRDDALAISVAPRGITALAISGVQAKLDFQQQALIDRGHGLSSESRRVIELGDTRAMLLSFSRQLTSAYIYCREDAAQIKRINLTHRPLGTDADWSTREDASFPYEFSIPVDGHGKGLEFSLEVTRPSGVVDRSDVYTLVQ